MSYFVAIFVFILTLGLTTKTLASTNAAAPAATCAAESKTTCAPAAAPHAAHGGHLEKMNSLFPEKMKDPALSKTPSTVELVAPKFLARVDGAAKLEWKEAAGANAYHVQVATDPNFKWLVTNEHFVNSTEYTFTPPEAGKKYFWRVAAFNTNNDSSFTKSLFSGSAFLAK